jgi:hypothetical protein
MAAYTLRALGCTDIAIAPRSRLVKTRADGSKFMAAYGNDYFGLFDLIALMSDLTVFIQVKGGARRTPPDADWRGRVAELAPPWNRCYMHWWLQSSDGPVWRIFSWECGTWWEWTYRTGEPEVKLLCPPVEAVALRTRHMKGETNGLSRGDQRGRHAALGGARPAAPGE